MKKRGLTLLEVMIGILLTGMIVSFLISSLLHLTQANVQVQKMEDVVHKRAIVHLRLSQIFDHLIIPEDKATFYTDSYPDADGEALYFSYNAGIDSDASFCGDLEGILYQNSKKQLCLTQCAKKGKEREEILVEKITSFQLEFYHPEKKEWVGKWTDGEAPPIVRLSFNGASLVFLLPTHEVEIDYS